MRERIMERLLARYLRTFPPIDVNGNGAFAEFKRWMLLIPINIVGGKHTRELVEKISRKWVLTT